MKSETVDPEKRAKEMNTALLVHAFLGGVFGAVGGVITALMFGPLAVDWFGFNVEWWHGLLVGAVFGSLEEVWRTRSEFKYVNRLEEPSLALGLEPLAGAGRGMIASRIEKLLEQEVTFVSAYFNENEYANIVTGDVRLTRRVRSTEVGESEQVTHAMHSYVYFRFDGYSVPHFKLMPETLMKRVVDKFLKRDIDFEDSPGFSRAYHLESKSEDHCRQLFGPRLRRELEKKSDWEIYGQGSWLVFFRRKKFRSGQDQKDYLNDCLIIADLFHETLGVRVS